MVTQDPLKLLKPLVRSEYFNQLLDVLQSRKENIQKQLLNCEEQDLKKLQGQALELDYFLNLKSQINAELAPRKS